MARHQQLGAAGEALAVAWLQARAFLILHCNWRHSHCEVDIIASKEDTLHFIEVKTRQSIRHGLPEESVTPKKIRHLMDAGEAYQALYPQWKRIQYNVLSITMGPAGAAEFFFIEDIYL